MLKGKSATGASATPVSYERYTTQLVCSFCATMHKTQLICHHLIPVHITAKHTCRQTVLHFYCTAIQCICCSPCYVAAAYPINMWHTEPHTGLGEEAHAERSSPDGPFSRDALSSQESTRPSRGNRPKPSGLVVAAESEPSSQVLQTRGRKDLSFDVSSS